MLAPQKNFFIPDQKKPYSRQKVDALLAQLKALLPELVSFRTDRFKGEPISNTNTVRGVFEFNYTTLKFTIYGDEEGICRHIEKQTKLHRTQVPKLLEVVRQLAEINNAGSWMLAEGNGEQMVYENGCLNGGVLERNHYLVDTCEYMAEDIPNVAVIEIHHQGHIKPGRRVPKRHFFRFLDKNGDEIAALDASGFALHARQQILQMDPDKGMLRLNLYRMKLWAEQLGTTPDALAELFPILGFMAAGLHMTKLVLKKPKDA